MSNNGLADHAIADEYQILAQALRDELMPLVEQHCKVAAIDFIIYNIPYLHVTFYLKHKAWGTTKSSFINVEEQGFRHLSQFVPYNDPECLKKAASIAKKWVDGHIRYLDEQVRRIENLANKR